MNVKFSILRSKQHIGGFVLEVACCSLDPLGSLNIYDVFRRSERERESPMEVRVVRRHFRNHVSQLIIPRSEFLAGLLSSCDAADIRENSMVSRKVLFLLCLWQ